MTRPIKLSRSQSCSQHRRFAFRNARSNCHAAVHFVCKNQFNVPAGTTGTPQKKSLSALREDSRWKIARDEVFRREQLRWRSPLEKNTARKVFRAEISKD